MDDDQHEKKKKLISNQLTLLMESFDNVQIFASTYQKETQITHFWSEGDGNVFAREGHVRDWLENVEHKEYRKTDGETEP